jgi:hypothetical protein
MLGTEENSKSVDGPRGSRDLLIAVALFCLAIYPRGAAGDEAGREKKVEPYNQVPASRASESPDRLRERQRGALVGPFSQPWGLFGRPFELKGEWLSLARDAKLARRPQSLKGTLPFAPVGATSFEREGESAGLGEPEDTLRRRLEYFTRQRAYPGTELPRARIEDAIRRYQAESINSTGALSAAATGIVRWTALGPFTISSPNPSYELDWAGRVTGVAIDPTNPNTIYVSSPTGGVWKTVNGGASWVPLTDSQCSGDISALAMDPVDPQILYATTGDEFTTAISCGILRTVDGGSTWKALPEPGGKFAASLWIDRASAGSATSTIVYAATWQGLYRSANSGQSWSLVLLPSTFSISDVIADPVTTSTLYAGGSNWDGSGGMFKSTNNGLTWSPASTGLPATFQKVRFAASSSSASTVTAAIATTWSAARLYKTTDHGATWIELPAAQTLYPDNSICPAQCTYNLVIAVDPTNSNVLWFGAIHLFRSTDGGATFQYVLGENHADQHVLTFHPTQPNTLFVGNDGGVYRNINGATVSTLNTNLAITQFYPGLGVHPTDPLSVIGGTQDNGGVSFSGGGRFSWICCGDAGYGLIDPSNPSVAYMTNQANGGPERLENGGTTPIAEGLNLSENRGFISPLAMDPLSPSTLYYGLSRLYRTVNRGDLWQAVSPPLDNGTGYGITAIAIAPSNTATVYVASGPYFSLTTNAFGSWQTLAPSLGWISHIAVSPTNPGTAYVTVSGSTTTSHVFKTSNYGAQWQAIAGGLPDIPASSIVIFPQGQLFAATDLGIFSSSNDGASWTPANSGLPNVRVLDVVYNPGTHRLLAATFGRGLYEYPIGPVTITTLGGSANPSLAGQRVTFTASVTSQTSGTITGTVTFKDGGTTLGTGTIVGGSATYSSSGLSTGSHVITAHYNGDANFYASVSASLQQVVNASPFGPPPFFSATATSTSQALLSWGAVSNAESYEVYRATSLNDGFGLVVSTAGTSIANGELSPNMTYLYKVRAVAGGVRTSFSSVDAATTVIFTDPTLSAGTVVKAPHFNELRTAVNAMRVAASLSPTTFTDSIAIGSTVIKRLHLIQLRAALDEARAAAGLSAISYTETAITVGGTTVKTTHILELRAGTQ